jgi:nucleoprotein TPR
VDTKLSELRSVVAYLRKEKEIVDLQLELSKQENARLKAQIDHLSQSLDDTRATLSEVMWTINLHYIFSYPGSGT